MKGDSSFRAEDTKEEVYLPAKGKRKRKVKKLEFIGWGSRPLLEFLDSIGIDTSKLLTQKEVSSLIIHYIKSNKLFHPQKKSRVLCDDRLHALFGKKFVSHLKIYDLLEVHFVENHDESEDEPYISEEDGDDDDDARVSYKEKKATTSAKKHSHEQINVHEAPKSCFAAVIPENIKLIYLKRSVVKELLKIPESCEEKIKGSFVRVKSDPNDYLQKHAYHLQQITGMRKISKAGYDGTEIQLQVTKSMIDIPLHILSDDNFSEEECEDLRERVKAGLIKKPTVVELDAKAKVLHEDITKHWIAREIKYLQILIDRANEKGRCEEKIEYMERKQLLLSKSEQTRLLSEVPKVISEELELLTTPMDIKAEVVSNCSPSETSEAVAAGVLDAHETPKQVEETGVLEAHEIPKQLEKIVKFEREEDGSGQQDKELLDVGIYESKREERKDENSQLMPERKVVASEVIELSDDDEDKEEAKKPEKRMQNTSVGKDLRDSGWFYLDPHGEIRGPFLIPRLRFWMDKNYFPADITVWKAGQNKEQAVLLTDVIRRVFPDG